MFAVHDKTDTQQTQTHKKVMLTFAKNTHRETPEKNLVKTAATYTQRAQKILFYSEAL